MSKQSDPGDGLAGEAEMARLLLNTREGASKADFRAQARASFLAHSVAGKASQECNPSRSADLDMADSEDYLRSKLPMPQADQAYRAELRRRFVDFGAAANREDRELLVDQEPQAPRGRLFRLGVLAAAIAAAIFVTFYLPSDAQWRLENPGALEGVLVDGELLGPGDEGQLVAALRRGALLKTSGRDLNLDLSMGMRLRILANSSVAFGPLPEAGSHHELGFEVEHGEIFLETSPSYLGNPIRIETVDVEVMVTGTALGVLVDDHGTCTCVEHGEVAVTRSDRADEPAERVLTHHLYLVRREQEGRRMDFEELLADDQRSHVEPLVAFAGLR